MSTTKTFCRITGFALDSAPTLFDSEASIRFAQHWLFSANYSKLCELANAATKTEQRHALTLAFLLLPTSLRSKLHIYHPITLNRSQTQKIYYAAQAITHKLHALSPSDYQKALDSIPDFTTRGTVEHTHTAKHFLYTADYKKQLLDCAASFTDYVTHITHKILSYNCLDIDATLDELRSNIEKQNQLLLMRESKKRKQARLVEQAQAGHIANVDILLDDIAVAFDLPVSELQAIEQQLRKPTNHHELANIASLVRGLHSISIEQDGALNVTAAQYAISLEQINAILANLNKVSFDFTLAPIPANTGTTTNKPTIQLCKPTIQLCKPQGAIAPTVSASQHRMNTALAAKLEAMQAKAQAKHEAKQQAKLELQAKILERFKAQLSNSDSNSE